MGILSGLQPGLEKLLGNNASGLLGLPAGQGGGGGLLGNPLFQMGMGLLSHRANGNINPYQAALGGLQSSMNYQLLDRQRQQEEEKKAREDKAREELLKVIGPTLQVPMGPPSPQGGMPMENRPNPNYDPVMASLAQADDLRGAATVYSQLRGQLDPTTSMRDFAYRKGLSGEDAMLWDAMNARSQNTPASLQEMQWLANATPEERELYWRNKRAGQLFNMGGGGVSVLEPGGDTTSLVTPEDATKREAELAGAKAGETTASTDQAEAAAKLPGFKQDLDATSEFIDRLIEHPGREAATGKSGWFNPLFVPGSSRRDFMALLETAQGKQFAVAYETLKGGGAITQIETEQATKALGNLSLAQSDEQFKQALEDFRSAMQRGYDKLATRAGQPPLQKNSGAVIRYDAQGNRIQ